MDAVGYLVSKRGNVDVGAGGGSRDHGRRSSMAIGGLREDDRVLWHEGALGRSLATGRKSAVNVGHNEGDNGAC